VYARVIKQKQWQT